MPFPSPPWPLTAQMWLSLFAVRSSGVADRPAGLYGVALVDYQEPSPLTYHELLVARLVREGARPRIRITDIWVDSPASRDGGRSLWAIPKELADLPLTSISTGPVERTRGACVLDGSRVAEGRFSATPAASLLRTPLAGTLTQLRDDGAEVLTPMRGSARSLFCLGAWDFDPDGPLGWLHGRRPLASLRLVDARIVFD
ncbi:MAG: acetoacetate decarboxylase family protein [Nocardioidaceae bacterium]